MFWKKKPAAEEVCAHELYEAIAQGLAKEGNRIRVEDLLTTTASITGESCIAAAGNFNPRKHQLTPGSRVFSDKVNELFAGDSADDNIEKIPANSVVGILRDKLLRAGYAKSDFPSLKMIF